MTLIREMGRTADRQKKENNLKRDISLKIHSTLPTKYSQTGYRVVAVVVWVISLPSIFAQETVFQINFSEVITEVIYSYMHNTPQQHVYALPWAKCLPNTRDYSLLSALCISKAAFVAYWAVAVLIIKFETESQVT